MILLGKWSRWKELNFNAAYGARSLCFDTQVTQNSRKNLE